MKRQLWLPAASVVISIVAASPAFTAANTIASSAASVDVRAVGANDLKPSQCSSLSLEGIATGTGTVNGTDSDDLVLGGVGVDVVSGKKGDDCIVGGDGDDSLAGNQGTDVCIGGPGNDTFAASCETQIQ